MRRFPTVAFIAIIFAVVVTTSLPATAQCVVPSSVYDGAWLNGGVFNGGPASEVGPTCFTNGTASNIYLGCRNTGGLTDALGNPYEFDGRPCNDIFYTGGELGKGWNELDFVPYRYVATAQPNDVANTPYYDIVFGTDNQNATLLGYDFMTDPKVNLAESTPGACQVVADIGQTSAAFAQGGFLAPQVVGGASITLWRAIRIQFLLPGKCVIDWASRLAIGAAAWPGAKLHTYLLTSFDKFPPKGGLESVAIDVGPSTAQGLAKTMTAATGTGFTWSVWKSANPVSITFPNTCAANPQTSQDVNVNVFVQATPGAGGSVPTITTGIAATNPAHSTIYVNVTDVIYGGSDQSNPLNTATTDGSSPGASLMSDGKYAVLVPANTAGSPVMIHTYPDTSGGGYTSYNDIATSLYYDSNKLPITDNGNQEQTTAKANATIGTSGGDNANATATVSDNEQLTPDSGGVITGFTVNSNVASPYVLGLNPPYLNPNGSLTPNPPYGPVLWASPQLNASDFTTAQLLVTFNKTVSITDPPPSQVSGTLFDTASVLGSSGFSYTMPNPLTIPITTDGPFGFTIEKTVDHAPASQVTFTFDVTGPESNPVTGSPFTITFNAGDAGPKYVSVPNLVAGTYNVTEESVTGWTTAASQQVTVGTTAGDCGSGKTIEFDNRAIGSALVVTKDATPAFNRNYTWGITKGVSNTASGYGASATQNISGGTTPFYYQVVASQTGVNDSGWTVTGTIHVKNPNFWDETGVTVTDAIDNGGTCVVTNGTGATIPAGTTVDFAYTCNYSNAPSPASGTNTGTATFSDPDITGTSATGQATADFGSATPTKTNQTITVGDTVGTLSPSSLTATDSAPFTTHTYTYSAPWGGTAGTCVNHPNTASISGDSNAGDTTSAGATATVCEGADLTVVKTATPSMTTSIKKTGPSSPVENSGNPTLNYTITVTESGWNVVGSITVSNPNDWESITAAVGDPVVTGWGTSCTLSSPLGNYTLTKSGTTGSQIVITYSCNLTATQVKALVTGSTANTNTATATWSGGATPDSSKSGTAAFGFVALTITDAFNLGAPKTLGTVNPGTGTVSNGIATTTFPDSYTVTLTAGTCTTVNNTATITQTNQQSSVKVTACNTKTNALTMGFWQGATGQKTISATPGGCAGVITYLTNISNLGGTGKGPFSDLTGTTCSALNTYVNSVTSSAANSSVGGVLMLKGQMLASALTACYSGGCGFGNLVSSQGTIGGLGNVWILLDPSKGTEDDRPGFTACTATSSPYCYNTSTFPTTVMHVWGEQVLTMVENASVLWAAGSCSAKTQSCTTGSQYGSKANVVDASDAFVYINQSQANISAP